MLGIILYDYLPSVYLYRSGICSDLLPISELGYYLLKIFLFIYFERQKECVHAGGAEREKEREREREFQASSSPSVRGAQTHEL